ncbi:MAG TPA: immunoglobulin domain-containing protein [Candidatus Acidoferrum sp.]|nr:immunoglobulin domain-containing protein [Candidatus Acidoferrum sp.]
MKSRTRSRYSPPWLLFALLAALGGVGTPGGAAPAKPGLLPAAPAPIDLSPDGELVLLFLPGNQGFELVNTLTGWRDTVSHTPNAGYFATLSPDKQFVCYKDFQPGKGQLLQVPVLYRIADQKQLPLADPAPAAGNPVVSTRGQVAYTIGSQLVVLNPDLSRATQTDLGTLANVLAFSPDGRRLAFSDPDETISWIDVDTGQRGSPPAGAVSGYQPRFSPDGTGLLARRSNGAILAWRAGLSRSLGRADAATWLDDDTVAVVQKDVADFGVTRTHVRKHKLSDGSVSTLLSRAGDVAVALSASAVALNAEDGLGVADTRLGTAKSVTLAPAASQAAPKDLAFAAPSGAISPMTVTNGSVVQLVGVPYVNQVYDTPDNFSGYDSCCSATASLMAIQYYNRLPPHPITCSARSSSHTSYYGYYICNVYSYNGFVFNIPSSSIWGSSLAGWYGGFGYFLQDTTDDSLLHSQRLAGWIAGHGLTSGTYDLPQSGADLANINLARAEINANHPVVLLNSLTSAGHYITCIGYVQNQFTLIFNDPYGNKNVSYPSANGAGAYYDWPGYNNGYQNLNAAWRYVYARGTVAANTNWGSYWDRNGATSGSGGPSPAGTWDSTSTNWSSSAAGTVSTGPWAEQNAIFSAGSDATGSYTVSVTGTQLVVGLFVQSGTATFTGGNLYFLGTGSYFTNYVAAGATAIFNTPFVGTGAPDKWGPGTAVYSGASTCAGYYTLNQGTLAFGNNAALGSIRLDVGDTAGANTVTLETADASARALPNYLNLLTAHINIGAGGNLTFSGPINVNSSSAAARIIAVSNSLTTFSGVLSNTCGITKTGPGTLVLSGSSANTYGSNVVNGYTTVSGGTLKLSKTAGTAAVANGTLVVNAGGVLLLGAANQIADTVSLTLAGGTFQSAGYSEQLGTLKLSGSSVIDLGSGSSVLTFAASGSVAWSGGQILTITNWNGSIAGGGAVRVVFGNSGSGLTAAQVAQICFVNPAGFPTGSYVATLLPSGEVVPLTVRPSFTSQPLGAVAVVGNTVSLSCAASGIPAPAYQWRLNGTNLPGATAATLVLPGVTLAQGGTYSVVATNVAGTTNSPGAVLAVYSTAAPTLCGAGCATDGQLQMNVVGVPGYQYAILASSNLTDWCVLLTNSSPFTFNDTNSSACPQRFYRAQYLP